MECLPSSHGFWTVSACEASPGSDVKLHSFIIEERSLRTRSGCQP